MTVFDPEENKKNIKSNLDQMLEVFAHMSMGDFSRRIDVSRLPPDDDFTKVLCGLDMMMDDLIESQNELAEIKQKLEQQVLERTSQLASVNEHLSREIEGRKKIETELRDSEEHYRLLAESAHDFIYIFDRTFIISYVNNAVVRLLGLPKEGIVGKNVSNFIPLSRIGLKDFDIFEAIKNKVPFPRQFNAQFQGGTIWLDTILVPIHGDKGDVKAILGISRDITEQKKSSEALVEREKFLSDIFSSIQDGISILDKDLTVIRVNSIMEKWYSHAMPVAGKKCYEVYHSRTEPCHVCPSINAIRTKKAAYEVVPLHGKDGVVLGWQDLYAFPMFDEENGTVKGVIEYVRDITVRRQAEEKLRQSESLFRTLAETAGAGIFIVKNQKICYVNPLIEKATGYTNQELLAMNFWDIVHPDFRDEIKRRYSARMRGEKFNPEYEFKFLRKDGTDGWVTHNVGLIEYDGGPAVIGTLFITTERKKAEVELSKEKELLSVTMESIGDGVITIDTSGNILTINKNALGLACKPQDAVGKHIDDIMCFLEDQTKEPRTGIIGVMLARYGFKRYERRTILRCADNTERLIDLSVTPISADSDSNIGMVLVFRDVTEHQKLEAELFKARKLESLGVLAGGIAHDFNNILTGVITNLFMAKVKVKADSDTYQLIAEAEKASFRASKLVKQLLIFSKGGAPVKEAVSIKDIIEDSVGYCLSGSNVNYRLELAPDLSLVEADRGQIDQVLNNLIINADQAMPNGGTITVKAENFTLPPGDQEGAEAPYHALPAGAYVKVTVSDEGGGIPKDDLEKIFDPYFTTKPNGNGLGLTIAYSIVKSHKGFIAVDSQMEKGTVFSFFLPVARAAPEPAGGDALHAALAGTVRVLVMDDDSAVRSVVTQLLKNSGYSVVCTSSGEQSIKAYGDAMQSGKPFDVVVMDLTVPGGMGGKETVGKIREMDPKAKVIVSSGYSNDPVMANYKDYGFCGIIAKPFNIDEFLGVIKKAISVSPDNEKQGS